MSGSNQRRLSRRFTARSLHPSHPPAGTFKLTVTGGNQDARGYATVVPGNSPTITIHLTQ